MTLESDKDLLGIEALPCPDVSHVDSIRPDDVGHLVGLSSWYGHETSVEPVKRRFMRNSSFVGGKCLLPFSFNDSNLDVSNEPGIRDEDACRQWV